MDKEQLKEQIRTAFAEVPFPGVGNIANSHQSDESSSLETEFADKTAWQKIAPEFIDLAPNGFASALSFFSPAALHFYFPAYLIADIDGRLKHADVLFHLCHGFDEASRNNELKVFGKPSITWSDYAKEKWSRLNTNQISAIAAFLQWNLDSTNLIEFQKAPLRQALEYYWYRK